MTRPVRVYRLDITYPPGDQTWPAERLFLSRSGANHRADVLRQYGAVVQVVASQPVTW